MIDFTVLWICASFLIMLNGCVSSFFIACWFADGMLSNHSLFVRPSNARHLSFAMVIPGLFAIMSMVWPWIVADREAIMSLTVAIVITIIGVLVNVAGVICGISVAKRRKIQKDETEER